MILLESRENQKRKMMMTQTRDEVMSNFLALSTESYSARTEMPTLSCKMNLLELASMEAGV